MKGSAARETERPDGTPLLAARDRDGLDLRHSAPCSLVGVPAYGPVVAAGRCMIPTSDTDGSDGELVPTRDRPSPIDATVLSDLGARNSDHFDAAEGGDPLPGSSPAPPSFTQVSTSASRTDAGLPGATALLGRADTFFAPGIACLRSKLRLRGFLTGGTLFTAAALPGAPHGIRRTTTDGRCRERSR